MKKFLMHPVLLVIGAISLLLAACGSDEPDEPELAQVSVNPTSISLTAASGSQASFTITSTGTWNITGIPEWLNLSSASGNGTANLTVTALSDNNTVAARACDLTINGEANTVSISISQLPGLQEGCEVIITDRVVLNESFALKLSFGKNADYFYAGYLSNTAAGWTDEKICKALEENGNAREVEDDYILTADGFVEGEKVFQCFVAYDKNGKRGEVVRETITIPSSKNAPTASIGQFQYNDTKWFWTTTIGATANEYYMMAYDNEDIPYILYYYFTNAEIGFLFKDSLSSMTSYVQSQEWQMQRDGSQLYVATWARRDRTWSSVLLSKYGYISDSRSGNSRLIEEQTSSNQKGMNIRSMSEYRKILDGVKIYKLK